MSLHRNNMDDSLEKQEPDTHSQHQRTHDDEEKSNDSVPGGHHHAAKEHDPAYLVDFEPNDPENPMNWSKYYKAFITVQLGFMALSSSLGSSIISCLQGKGLALIEQRVHR